MYTRRQLAEKAKLSIADIMVVWRCRRDYNRFGMAYQLGFVRLFNRFPTQDPLELFDELITYTGLQLKLDSNLIDTYQKRQQTISVHQQRIIEYLGLRPFGESESRVLEEFLFHESCRIEQTSALRARAEEFLKEQRILEPSGETRIVRMVGEQRRRAREHIFRTIAEGIPKSLSHKLDELLEVRTDENVSDLQKIKANPSQASADSMLAVVRKLETIETTGVLDIDLSWLNSNYQRALFHQVRKSSVHRIREFAPHRRNAALVCFLWQSYHDAVDQAVDIFDKLMVKTQTHAKNELAEHMGRERKTIQSSLATLKSIGSIILDETIDDTALRVSLFARVPRAELESRLSEIDEWVTGRRSDAFHGVVRRYGHLRKFTPAFLNALELNEPIDENACLQGLNALRRLNEEGKRKLPDDTPIGFVPQRLQSIVGSGDAINRHAWECALLIRLRDELRSGNVSVKHSKRFGKLDDFFMDAQQ